ncbi:hypothetical protein HHI36_019721 [Cryptolaemus montrouzieri]|uniref:Uncharacterized protein n=1 Tax=Cryptolaemus montrouzieri TaxID=559131 RepID=A0ABD2N8M9_9CUCU
MNIDIKDTANRLPERYLNLIYASGYESHVNSATRVGEHKNIFPIVSHSKIRDHSPVLLKINMKCENGGRCSSNAMVRNINYRKFAEKRKTVNGYFISEEKSLDICLQQFIDIVKENSESATTVRIFNSKNRKRKEWITGGIVNSINIRDELHNDENNAHTKEKYIQYRDKINVFIRDIKTRYFRQKIEGNRDDLESYGKS